MRDLMRLNVAEPGGTGRRAEVRGYRVGGKTGTAEMPGVGGYQRKAVISSFVAAFPMDAPRYVVFVLLFEPKGTEETKRRDHGRPATRRRPTGRIIVARRRRCSACCRSAQRRTAAGSANDI